jgi:hypothetical protein
LFRIWEFHMSRFASMICFSFSLAVAAFLEPVGTLADEVPEGGLYLPDQR